MKQLLIFLFLILAACSIDMKPVSLKELKSDQITVSIEGEVEEAGTVEMNLYDTVDDLLQQVTLKDSADLTVLNRQTVLKDHDVIVIPEKKEEGESRISINQADAEQLMLLPGIGRSTAEKIVLYRNQNGHFQSIEDLTNVSGIGEAKLEKLRDYISL